MFQVGDIVAMDWPTVGQEGHARDSWSYGVVTGVESSHINVLWFHNDVDIPYRTSYAMAHFNKVENGKG